ncbi:hypothetical protein O6H91_01G056000 [Diphasiastrum complanatum]|uniref:Uncharacterized protein n=1 Tax=Diphasiastrum complanatum TaxID=34168 RepID=A0ACC2ER98_DIPCM|nr:hypothetical protein O6H91_01G056000 [Diphasiastrum complanatum]
MDLKAAISDQTTFVLDFYKIVAQNKPDQNAVLSPLSISLVLAMAAAGAQGTTLDQIISCLKLPKGPHAHDFAHQLRSVVLTDGSMSGGPQLSFVNGIWVEQTLTLKPSFKQVVEEQYEAVANHSDFIGKADDERKIINSWVAEQTKGKIQDILPPGSLDSNTRLVLANALYFKGIWQKKFESGDTSDGEFYLLNGDSVKLPMMRSQKKHLIKNCGSYKVLKLPYVQGEDKRAFSMYIFLPDKRNGLPELQKGLDVGTILQELSRIQEVPVGNFQLPRFKIDFGLEAIDTLQNLGLVKPFSDEADFSALVDSPQGRKLYVSNVFHKGFIEVNEEGTEAAAATAAVIKYRSLMMNSTEDFVADHPFLFLIREELTGVIMFVGHVINPFAG